MNVFDFKPTKLNPLLETPDMQLGCRAFFSLASKNHKNSLKPTNENSKNHLEVSTSN